MSEYAYCKDCTNFRGYSNTGYWCAIDKEDVDEYYCCKCFDNVED